MCCSRVQVIFFLYETCPVHVYCPACGRLGKIHRKRMNTYGIGHEYNMRCSTTAFPKHQKFAGEVVKSFCQMSSVKLIQKIRSGKLNTIIPTVGDNNNGV
jgi:hypothetical protein